MKQEPHCVSSLMEYKMSLTLKEMPVILNSSRISLLKVWPRNTLCNIVFQEEKTPAFLSVAHSGPQTTLKGTVLSPSQCGLQVGGTGFEVRLPRFDMSCCVMLDCMVSVDRVLDMEQWRGRKECSFQAQIWPQSNTGDAAGQFPYLWKIIGLE